MAIDRPKVDKFPHIAELDGIRALSVAIVFIVHLKLSNGVQLGKYVPGGLAVSAFFFLSGYLITSLLRLEFAQTGRVSFRGFYYRRVLRIFPPFYVAILFSGLAVLLGLIPVQMNWPSVALQALFLSNYGKLFGLVDGVPGPPLWSLAVEEHFYLLFPLLFAFVLSRMRSGAAMAICVGLCLLALLFRIIHGQTVEGLELNYFMSHTRMDAILAGCILGLWNNPVLDKDAWRPKFWQAALATIVMLGSLLYRDPYWSDTWRYTIHCACFFVMFSWVLHGNAIASRVLTLPPLVTVGKWSYTIYLVHGIMLLLVEHNLPTHSFVMQTGTALAMTLLYAGISYNYMERPLTRMRQKNSPVEEKDAAPDDISEKEVTPVQSPA
ncbi:MAG: acyltransferase family protein [Sphingobium sp.]